ncbi:MAG: AMP-binding protein [Clostridia bacterium]|nr:AMP-binding protein [Clostridia bacterium]
MAYDFHKKFVREEFDENGVLTSLSFAVPEHFNFAYDVVDELAKKEPDKLAMLWIGEDGAKKRITFGDVSRESDRVAAALAAEGLKKGDKALLILKRRYEFWYTVIALHKLGVVGIPATNQLAAKDIEYRIKAADVSALIAIPEDHLIGECEAAMSRIDRPIVRVTVDKKKPGWLFFDEIVENAPPFSPPADRAENGDTMLLYFTSGTTGMPKMVMHDFYYPIAHITTAKYWHKVDPEGLHLTVSETGWMKAMWGKLYGQWFMESAVFVYDMDRFHADDLLRKIGDYKITTFCAPPTIYRFFIKEDLSKYDLSSLKHATTAGEALNPEVHEQFKKATGLSLMEGFGQTETTLTVANFYWMKNRPGSMGKPSPVYDLRVLDAEHKPCPPGVVGEICIDIHGGKPCGMFSGYYKDTAGLLDSVIRDGFYHTGDTAWADEDGFLWYVGRTDDIIKSSGYRIGPFEVESVLMEHPSVLECAVTGVPDPIRGQVVKATVVLSRGYEPSEELKKELQTYVKSHTAPYKYPRVVEFVAELPKTISGKIKRNEIRERDHQK